MIIYIVYKDTIGVRRCHNWCHNFQVTSCQKHVSGVLKTKTDKTDLISRNTLLRCSKNIDVPYISCLEWLKLLQSMELLDYTLKKTSKSIG